MKYYRYYHDFAKKVLFLPDRNLNEWMTHLLTLLHYCQELAMRNKISDNMRIRKTQVEKAKDEKSMWDRTSSEISLSFACFTFAHMKWFPIEWQHRQVKLAYIQMMGESVSTTFEDLKFLKPRWGSRRRASHILPLHMQYGKSAPLCFNHEYKKYYPDVGQSNHWVIFH